MEDKDLEKFIKNSVKVITERLNLPPIKIEIDKWYHNGSYYDPTMNLGLNKPFLQFGLVFLRELKEERTKMMGFLEKIYFIVAHETAHYLQAA